MKKKQTNKDFTIIDTSNNNIVSESKNGETIITSYTEEDYEKMVATAIKNIKDRQSMGNIYNEESSTTTSLTIDDINTMSQNPQDNLSLAMEIGTYVRQFITQDDLIGKTYDAISNNVNSNFSLSYANFDEQRNKNKKLQDAKLIINQFNDEVDLGGLIRRAIPTTYSDGTYITYLSGDSKKGWSIDYFPLGIATITPYSCNGNPIVAIDMDKLKQKMKPSSDYKDKNRKNVFYQDIEELIKDTYPDEVYQAYKNKTKYAILDYNRAGVVRVGNLNRRYGVSPIFRAFKPLVQLSTYESSDTVIAKSKAKKIIFQKLNADFFKDKTDTDMLNKAALAQDQLISAWRNNTVIVTGLPYVESISYVEPTATSTSIDVLNFNRNRILTALGISFLKEQDVSVTSGSLSIKELLKCVNRIGEDLEKVIERYYKVVLADNNFEDCYVPKIKIIDSEQLEFNLKKDLSLYLFQTLGCSYETAYNALGINVKDEYEKRKSENELGYDSVFLPRATSFTTSGDTVLNNKGGRPLDKDSKNPDKQVEDKEKNKIK